MVVVVIIIIIVVVVVEVVVGVVVGVVVVVVVVVKWSDMKMSAEQCQHEIDQIFNRFLGFVSVNTLAQLLHDGVTRIDFHNLVGTHVRWLGSSHEAPVPS